MHIYIYIYIYTYIQTYIYIYIHMYKGLQECGGAREDPHLVHQPGPYAALHQGHIVYPVSTTRFPLTRFSPGAGLLRNPFVYTINAKIFQGLYSNVNV